MPVAILMKPAHLLPTFLGIGAARSGSTWLHRLLLSHPDIYVPRQRKELSYFDHDYDRGLAYYEAFFPPANQSSVYRAIGEVTPTYLYCAECPERIAALGVGRQISSKSRAA